MKPRFAGENRFAGRPVGALRPTRGQIMAALLRVSVLAVASLGLVAPVRADKPDEKPKVKIEIRRAETKAADGLTEATVAGTTEKVYLHKAADATNADVAGARVVENGGKPAIEVTFTKDGAKKMAALCEQHLDKPVAILIDGKVVAALVVKEKFSERAQISGTFTKEEAEKIAKGLTGK
jgi:preprotein translocase subunit SecD